MLFKAKYLLFLLPLVSALFFSSCSKLGWGILLWSTDDPPILSGTVLPVYIRSNIDHVWVVGVPDSSRKIEIPLSQFEFSGSKRKAIKRADEFAVFAVTYAENMQDGLPIRDFPDNGSRRVYRLRLGEIIKILDKAEGNPPISTTGDPLPGDWYYVLTNEGVTGYCFSYRLKVFNHYDSSLVVAPSSLGELPPDPDLEMVLSKIWSPEFYQQMINARRVNISEFEKNYRFDSGQDTGIARIFLPDIEKEFKYEGIYPDGERAWHFEGADLQISLRSNTTLAVQYLDNTNSKRTLLFVSLSADVDDIIMQEKTRRETQYMTIYNQGPAFTSSNFGTITLNESESFTWTGFEPLVPQLIPAESGGRGKIYMDIFLSPTLSELYSGAFTLRLTDVTPNRNLRFMYSLDSQGLRLEVVQDFGIEDMTVTRRTSSPMVLYFFRDLPAL